MQLLCAEVEDLLVQSLKIVQVSPSAEADGVAEDLLCAAQPCGAEGCSVDAELGGFIEKCVANQLSLGAERAGGSRFHDLLALVL